MPTLDLEVIRHGTKPGRYYDVARTGLFLRIRKDGTKQWGQRIGFEGRKIEITLGGCRVSSVSDARSSLRKFQDIAAENHRLTREEGVNPATRSKKRQTKSKRKPTFDECARQRHKELMPTFKTERYGNRWLSSLVTYAFPAIGAIPVDEVEPEDIKNIMLKDNFWQEKPVQAGKVLQRIKNVMRYARANRYRPDDPSEDMDMILPEQQRKPGSMPSVPYSEVGAVLEKIRGKSGVASAGLAFQIYTAVRPGEAREADWSEIDMDSRLWTIPAARMKSPREHVVPLSDHAVELLLELREDAKDDRSGLIFPNQNTGNPLSDVAFIKVMRDLGFSGRPHGFRSSFRTWVQEQTDYPREVGEAALAHVNPNRVEAAYARSNYLEKRRPLMQMWADYICGNQGAEVVALRHSG